MTNHEDHNNQKALWTIIVVAYILSAVVYIIFGYLVHKSQGLASPVPAATSLLPYVYAVATLAIVLGVLVMRNAVKGVGQGSYLSTEGPLLLTPSQFLMRTIVALTLAEAAPLLGIAVLFLSGRLTEVILFGAAVIAVFALYYLPQGLRYWGEVTAE